MNSRFKYKFSSILAPYMNRLIEIKISADQNPMSLYWKLKEFDMFANKYGLVSIDFDESFISAWRETRGNDSPRTISHKYSAWRQLTQLMQRLGCKCIIPRPSKHPNLGFVPYIFTRQQICEIFKALDGFRMPIKNMNFALFPMPTIFRVLYSTGMRVSEAVSLSNSDIDINGERIRIRKSKSRKERVIALSDSLKAVLSQYIVNRDTLPIEGCSHPDRPFFIKPDGTTISEISVYKCFRKVLKKVGIEFKGNHLGPRVHDIRHTFAVHSLAKMVNSEIDIYAGLPLLSTVLGHSSINSTEVYVRLTVEQFPEIENLLKGLNQSIYPSYIPDEEERQ